MSVTVQRFHAVLELKNELAQLAAGMPLFPQHMRGPPPDHDDSLDTSHVQQPTHVTDTPPTQRTTTNGRDTPAEP